MMYNRYKRLFFITLSILIMDARTLALAAQDFPISPNENFDVFFNKEQSLSDADLDGMRGGFLASNGMIIDFIFSTNTLVNGQLVNQIVLNSADPSATNVNSLRNIIQIGEGNSAFNGTFDANSLPNVLTIIQNNINDLTIQQVNLMDLSVKNMSNFVRQSVTPEMVFQSTFRIVP